MKEKIILVVDDDDPSFLLLNIYLEKRDFKTIRSSTGAQAIESCKTNYNISLVLLDYRLPDINGIDVCKSIKSLRPDINIIFLSATDDPAVKNSCSKAGGLAYITKPTSYFNLMSIIADFLCN